MSNLMEMEVYNAAVNGDITIFSMKNHEQLLMKTHQKNNIIHVAANYKQIHFIQATLNNFPSIPNCESLICDQNCHGNTPLHIAAEVGEESVIDHLYEFFSTHCGSDRVFPWRVTNKDCNTSAHVALLYGNVGLAMYLVEKDDYVARVINLSQKTLLHLAIQYHDFDNYEPQMPDTQAPSSSKKVYQPREDLWSIIELLLKRESSVACWTDADGLTPLHRAATLDPAYCIRVIKAMLASCPGAAEVHDERCGQTILHLLTNHQVASFKQGLELLQIPQVYALRNSKNHQGDTPLHLAARNRDTIMVRVLLESSPNLGLMNDGGVSAGSLVRQFEEMKLTTMPVQERRKLTKEERDAAKQGNVEFLDEKMVSVGIDFLVSRTPKDGNILHILMQCNFSQDIINEVEEFIGRSIQRLPLLIFQNDCNGNTPIHVLAENTNSVKLLELSYKYFEKVREEARGVARGVLSCSPWSMKNIKGDMPLHIAVRANQYVAAIMLLEFDEELSGYVNIRNETPLHLLAAYHKDYYGNDDDDDVGELIRCLINGNDNLPYMQDVDGLTPLLVSIRERNRLMIRKLLELFPDCAKIADFKGNTLWHWLVHEYLDENLSSTLYYEFINYTWKLMVEEHDNGDIRRLMISEDNDGNTPLHLAIANHNFGFLQYFLENCKDEAFISPRNSRSILLSIKNKEGASCFDLIGAIEHLPRELEKFMLAEGDVLFGNRSMYDIPTTKIEAYTSIVGIIAALLVTITFTAAFTVPGGLDSSNGTPLLLQKATFQVFLVADVVAMCSSMIVLFCLLWIMTTSDKKRSILLLDVSVLLLQISFRATLVTFMTGLYVTTIQIAPAIAISTCVASISLIILVHKRLFELIVVPFFVGLIILGRLVGRILSYTLSYIWLEFTQLAHSVRRKLDGM